jgi:hypothetical protein
VAEVGAYALALALTLAVEVPLAALLAATRLRRRAPVDAALLNLVTHPLAYLAIQRWAVPFAAVELAVAGAEALGYHMVTRLGWRRRLAVSLVCNIASGALSWLPLWRVGG